MVDFYVDPVAGVDTNPGTATLPYRTLTHALSLAAAGDTILLATGNYGSASGEEWPTHSGSPPTAEANVPDGVKITTDGNLVRLVGPVGFDFETTLVFAGGAEVSGVNIVGFEVGVMIGNPGSVVLEDVQVSGSGEIGVLVNGEARLALRDSAVYDNSAIGLAVADDAVVTIEGTEMYANHPAVEASGAASVTIRGSDLHDNGSGPVGSFDSALSVMDDVLLVVADSQLRDNAYVGVHLRGAVNVTVGPGTDISGNYIGVLADSFLPGAASLAFDGATVRDNDFEGIAWVMPMGASLKLRDTAVIDNGDPGLFIQSDAAVIDLGTPDDPGGNDFSGNDEPLILDARSARAAPDGTIITVSHDDIGAGCLVPLPPLVGPANLVCTGVTVVGILNANNRVQVVESN